VVVVVVVVMIIIIIIIPEIIGSIGIVTKGLKNIWKQYQESIQ
jgi:predicted PurR-regulated permease PerM